MDIFAQIIALFQNLLEPILGILTSLLGGVTGIFG
jgi:hypothetical protein